MTGWLFGYPALERVSPWRPSRRHRARPRLLHALRLGLAVMHLRRSDAPPGREVDALFYRLNAADRHALRERIKALEQALNDTGFSPERFAETLPFFHKTLEQTFFKTIKVCIIAMAKRESCRIDSRNQASYEMCRMLAPMLEDTDLPFI